MATGRFRIRLLGGLAVIGPAGERHSANQRPAEAVLAVLAVSGELGCTRERLVGLLWSQSDESHARHSLRDALYAIRRMLGSDAVPGTGEFLHIDPAIVTSDVREFEEALGAGQLADAVTVYRGPLLDGFHIDGAPAFERWLDDERARLLREHQHAVKHLARAAEDEERWDQAADWWARAVAADPYNSRAVVRRIWALARAGDRANALKEAEAHCRLLRTVLDIEPDAAFMEELEHIRKGDRDPARYFTPSFGTPVRKS